MSDHARVAAVTAPWAVVPIIVIAGLGSSSGGLAGEVLWGTLIGCLFGVPIAYLGTLCLGVPAYRYLKKHGRLSAVTLSLVGGAPGVLAGGVLMDLRVFLVVTACGCSVAFTAWLILKVDLRPTAAASEAHRSEP